MIERTKNSFKTMSVMEKFRGHFFNWYDTHTLEPLSPQYVSTVDSGNLSGYLLTLKSGLADIKEQKFFCSAHSTVFNDILYILVGILDTSANKISLILKRKSMLVKRIKNLKKTIVKLEEHPGKLAKTLKNLSSIMMRCRELRTQAGKKFNPETDWWFQAFEDQCERLQEDLIFLAPWLVTLGQENIRIDANLYQVLEKNHTLAEIARIYEIIPFIEEKISKLDPSSIEEQQTKEFYLKLERLIKQGSDRAQGRIKELSLMADQCSSFADMEFDFLYDASRHLLSIGYNVSIHRRDESFYDLLASESRLCSLIGISQGKLPLEHWFSLGRLVTIIKGKVILLSWGGSMFEYLMPQLIMPGYDNSLLGQTCLAIVEHQIDYGHRRGVPWGIFRIS